jgi:hypothetical protein
MHPPETWTQVIQGKRYSIKTATLLASNEYWDGHNFERSGTNTHLWMTPKGAFFSTLMTQWQGERDYMTPLTREAARELFETLPERCVECLPGDEVEDA